MTRAEAIDLIEQYAAHASHLDDALSQHIAGMPARISEDHSERKVMRWLGWIQGVLTAQGVYTLEQVKEHSRSRSVEEP